jgi:magnesium transporter
MLNVFVRHSSGLVRSDARLSRELIQDAVWFDLLEPTTEEEKAVEELMGIDVPTREEMREIETSNRFYEENGTLYLTATVVTKLEQDLPEISQISFILSNGRLITNRYTDPLPFRRFAAYLDTHPGACVTSAAVLAALLEAIVNRIADVLERVGNDLDTLSTTVFAPSQKSLAERHSARQRNRDFQHILSRVGQSGEFVSKARESLVSLGRLLVFVQQSGAQMISTEIRTRLRIISRDVTAMSDHASFLGDKVSFALDATLGMLTIDQNNILKIFSFVTVFLLPPSVVGAFFGMNFVHMPWLQQPWGAGAALAVMCASAVVPFLYFKRRGWL